MSRLSIVVPVYNAQEYLEQCITSIVNELLAEDELILINDGSKDNSLEICKRFESDNVVVISNENHGVSYTRNCGNAEADGEYVMYVDSDDYLLPGWRASVEKGIVTGSDVVYFSPSGIDSADSKDVVRNILNVSASVKLDIKGGACWFKLFKRELINDNKIVFDSDIINGEDGVFSLQCFLCSKSFSIVKADNFYFYRTNNASATHTYNTKYNSSNIKYLKVVSKEISECKLFSADEQKQIIDYLTYNGLYILAYRISFVDDITLRRSYYKEFADDYYTEFWKSFKNKWTHQKFKAKIFEFLRNGKFDSAMKKIRRRRFIINLAKKVLRK